MNCSLLAGEDYVNSFTELISIWAAEGRKELSDDRSVWDWIKYNIRAHASWHSKKTSKEKKKKELSLQYELTEAKQASEKNPCDSHFSRYHEARENLEAFYEEKTKGIIISVRAHWNEHGE